MNAARQTQSAEILRLLTDARGAWVPLPQILDLGIAQYSARIFELRRAGHHIENKTESVNGRRRSWFRLVESPTPEAPKPQAPAPAVGWKDRPTVTGLPLWDSAVRQ
jgi:hypothetical protein